MCISKILRKSIVLCLYGDQIYFIKRSHLYSFSISSGTIVEIINLKLSKKVQILLRIALLRRLLRLEFHADILKLEESILIIIFKEIVYQIDLVNKKIIYSEKYPLKGRRPLHSDSIVNLKDFDDGIYYGEYFSNLEKEVVSIYRLNNEFEIAYQFKKGEVNHIHAIIADYYRDCLWILTGDFGNGSAIWQAKKKFKEITCICKGEQKFRSCVGFVLEKGLLYATDSPNDTNSLRMLSVAGDKIENIEICKLNGPSIYGVKLKNYYVFSTNTEPKFVDKFGYLNLLRLKPARGIVKNESFLIMVDNNLNVTQICNVHKDILPYGLFQFGTFNFPRYLDVNHNLLIFFSVGNRIKDYKIFEINLNNINHV